jgi:NAD(P)-dependent dehydrogenase (short-subunit alcohol dehydrogenase family)
MDGIGAVVVGGHSGFGEAIARRFVAEGATVLIAGRRTQLVADVAADMGAEGRTCDITDDAQVEALAADSAAWFDGHGVALHTMVNCAGHEQSTLIADLTPERLRSMQAVQLDGAISCMRHFGNALRDRGAGSVLSISSLTAQNPLPGLTAYASAKAAVEYATKIAAVEYGASGVRFNCLAPSLIETPMTERMFTNPAAIQALEEVTPLRRMGSVDDVAAAAVFLCSDMGSYITGQTICVDGGASLLMLPSMQMFGDVARRFAESQADT